ncbi:MAG: amidohydrolase family protein [Halioglobus sp.]
MINTVVPTLKRHVVLRLRLLRPCRSRLLAFCLLLAAPAWSYDLVIANGRVIDPESGLDGIRHVGIEAGRITSISAEALAGDETIDAAGQVVAPGFIDIHSHTPSLFGARLQTLDGVTTQLDLEAGAFPVTAYGEHFSGGALLNYGASVGHFAIRIKVIEGRDQPYLFVGKKSAAPGPAFRQPATPAQVEQMRAMLHEGIDQGGIGIGLLADYMSPALKPAEMRMIFEVAAEREVPVFVQVRRGLAGDPAGLEEVIGLAQETGAAALICHITHSAMGAVGDWLEQIDRANAEGARIATETLSWAAGGTAIGADVFSRNWREIFGIDYGDVQWTATGEWLTEETFNRYRREQPGGMINHHYVKEPWIHTALRWPRMMVVSDATPALDRDVLGNPNVSGTFTRVLGHYVRETGVLSLPDALARLSLYQAQWLEPTAPAFRRKGRLQVGADADIVVFDPATVGAGADYGQPWESPTGMHHVIVAGRPVVSDGEVVPGRYPGVRLVGETAR